MSLSKNSDVFLAGVEGSRNAGVRSVRLCLFEFPDGAPKEFLCQLSMALSKAESLSDISDFDRLIPSIDLKKRTIELWRSVNGERLQAQLEPYPKR